MQRRRCHFRSTRLTQTTPTESRCSCASAGIGRLPVKSMDTHAIRAMLVARAQLVTQKVKLTNCIRGLLKTFGIVLGEGKGRRFDGMVRERIVENPMLTTIIEPMLVALLTTREQIAVF